MSTVAEAMPQRIQDQVALHFGQRAAYWLLVTLLGSGRGLHGI